jgi:hypothetical protein
MKRETNRDSNFLLQFTHQLFFSLHFNTREKNNNNNNKTTTTTTTMIIPVRCFTCGKVHFDRALYFLSFYSYSAIRPLLLLSSLPRARIIIVWSRKTAQILTL